MIVAATRAYDLYLRYAMYFCQPGRSFQPIERIGFYTGNEIKPCFPRVLARRDDVQLSQSMAHTLQRSSSHEDAAIGLLMERLLADGVLHEGDAQQLFLLSPATDPCTLVLPGPIPNASVGPRGQRVAWTQKQRYVSSAALNAAPRTTADLDVVAVIETNPGEAHAPGPPVCSGLQARYPTAPRDSRARDVFNAEWARDAVASGPDSCQVHRGDTSGTTAISEPRARRLVGQPPWYQEIQNIHDRHFSDPWQDRVDAINQRYRLSRQHMLFTPDPEGPMPWFNGDIEAVEPGRWVLVISLNHYVNPDARASRERDDGARNTPESYWDHRRTFNTEFWYRKFFGPLARVAATALGEPLTREQEPAFATNRMILVEICPYGSQKFSLPWQTVSELLSTDPGFQLAADVNRLLIERGQPALVMVNGRRAIDMFEHLYADALTWRDIRYESCDLPREGRKPKSLIHSCGSLDLGQHAVPVVGFTFLRTPATHSSHAELALLAGHIRRCRAGRACDAPGTERRAEAASQGSTQDSPG